MDYKTNNKTYFLALNRMSQIGPLTIAKLWKRWPKLEELFQLSTSQLLAAGLSEKLTTKIKTFDLAIVKADFEWEQAHSDHHLLTWEDAHYPPLLKEIHDPPAVLYAKGNLDCFKQLTLAMIGSRKPSITGSETAKRFAYELAANPLSIVSGLALGIDTQAHKGCLEANGKTIAVMGTGIDRVYPYQNHHLAEKICFNGLLLSEFPLGTPPAAGHFPQRNRIISGLSLITLVVEAAIRSGSLITARMALEQNRDVFAIPGSILNPQARGCHYLLQQGAKLVTSSQDILEELNLEPEQTQGTNTVISLARVNQNLVKCIGFEITTIDQMVARSGLAINEVACELAILELEGVVKAIPGGYIRCL